MTQVTVRRGEGVEKSLRRLKKFLIRENLFKEIRRRRHYQKPSVEKRLKSKDARFIAMIKQRYADL